MVLHSFALHALIAHFIDTKVHKVEILLVPVLSKPYLSWLNSVVYQVKHFRLHTSTVYHEHLEFIYVELHYKRVHVIIQQCMRKRLQNNVLLVIIHAESHQVIEYVNVVLILFAIDNWLPEYRRELIYVSHSLLNL